MESALEQARKIVAARKLSKSREETVREHEGENRLRGPLAEETKDGTISIKMSRRFQRKIEEGKHRSHSRPRAVEIPTQTFQPIPLPVREQRNPYPNKEELRLLVEEFQRGRSKNYRFAQFAVLKEGMDVQIFRGMLAEAFKLPSGFSSVKISLVESDNPGALNPVSVGLKKEDRGFLIW